MTASIDAADADPLKAKGPDAWVDTPVLVGRAAERATLDTARKEPYLATSGRALAPTG